MQRGSGGVDRLYRASLGAAVAVPGGRRAVVALHALREWVLIRRTGAFDARWYAVQTGRPRRADSALWHYVSRGRREGLSPHPLFEQEMARPDDGRTTRADPFGAWLRSGPRRGHPVHPLLDDSAFARGAEPAASLLRRALAPGADLPPAPGEPHAPVPVGPVPASLALQVVDRAVRLWRAQEDLRTVARFTPDYDRDRERELLARWRHPGTGRAGGTAGATTADPSADPRADPTAMGQVRVSVVLPCWDRAEQVVTAIRSVQAQTETSWELLVVDDGSTDASAAAVAAIAATDPRVVLLRQEHAGVCVARNLGLARARGRWVAFLDADNTYLPDFLQVATAAMEGLGLRAAYAVLRARDGEGATTYRTLEAGEDVLRVRNFVDLNVLVVARDLLQQVGGFDPSLRRTVDYDLVLRLRRLTEIPLLPFVAVDYHHDAGDARRITNREAASWVEVVQSRAFVDWQGLAAGTQVPGRTSVLVVVDRTVGPRAAWLSLARLLASVGDADDVEVVVLDNASGRATGVALQAWAALDPRVQVHREPLDRHRALGSNLALAHATGDVVILAPTGLTAVPGWLAQLREGLADPTVAAVQPLLLTPAGTVASAGAVRPPGASSLPVPLLAEHPAEDARAGGARVAVPLLDDELLAARFADLVRVGGVDPLLRGALDLNDLSLRLAAHGGTLLCVTGAEVTLQEPGPARQQAVTGAANRREFRQRWGRTGSTPAPWSVFGLRLVGWQGDPVRPVLARPVLARADDPRADDPRADDPRADDPRARGPRAQVHERPGRHRWAIKTGAPAGLAGRSWGDVHFAEALADALRRLGQQVVVDGRDAHDRRTGYLDDVVLVLRGRQGLEPPPGAVSLCWVISHPDLVPTAELAAYDRVFAASGPWAARTARSSGLRVDPLLQCTEAGRFLPAPQDAPPGARALFVGNSRNVFRPVVRDALAAGLDVTLYGSRWERFIDADRISGTYLPNEELPSAYGTCGVLLNDHWDDMRREGFMSNRLFDATATGARVVTDDIPGVELFGGLVRTYTGVAELRALVGDGLGTAFPDREQRLVVAETVRREHSFDARGARLLEAVGEVAATRRG